MKHLQALLQGKCTSHILPFLWMKGEDNETIGKELDKIEKCGIREVCLESRPHPDFCGGKICILFVQKLKKEGFVSGFWMTKSFQPDMLTADLKSTRKSQSCTLESDIWTLWVPAAAVQSWWKILFLQMEDYWEFWQYQSQMDRPWQ